MIIYKRFLLDMIAERTRDIDRIGKRIGNIYSSLSTTEDQLLQDIYTRKLNAYIDEIEYHGKQKIAYRKLLDELDEDTLELELNMRLHKYHLNRLKGE